MSCETCSYIQAQMEYYQAASMVAEENYEYWYNQDTECCEDGAEKPGASSQPVPFVAPSQANMDAAAEKINSITGSYPPNYAPTK